METELITIKPKTRRQSLLGIRSVSLEWARENLYLFNSAVFTGCEDKVVHGMTTVALKIFLVAPNSHEVWLYFGFFFKKIPNISIWVIFTIQVNIISISPYVA